MTTGLLITDVGSAAIIADLAGGTNLVLSHVAFGDAAGVPYNPNQFQTTLVYERYRTTISSIGVEPGTLVIECQIPADTPDALARPSHGFNIAEAGLFASDGKLIALARMGNGLKPSPSSGQAAVATFQFKLACQNPSAITVVINPTAQIHVGRQVRPFWMTVDGVLNAPPPAPVNGQTHIVGPAPTGAWAGFPGRIAQWVGVWMLSFAPTGHVVGDNASALDAPLRYLRFDGVNWVSATVSESAIGLISEKTRRSQSCNFFAATSPGPNQIEITPTFPFAPGAGSPELQGVPIRFLSPIANTGAVSLKIGTHTYAMTWPDISNLREGDILLNQFLDVMLVGAAFRINTSASPAQLLRPPGRLVTMTSSGTFVPDARARWYKYTLIAGGASGTVGDGTSNGRGGGSGGYITGSFPREAFGATLAVQIGAGGLGLAPGAAFRNGNAGGASSIFSPGNLYHEASGAPAPQWNQINYGGGVSIWPALAGRTLGIPGSPNYGDFWIGGLSPLYPFGVGGNGSTNFAAPGGNGVFICEEFF